MRIEFKAWNTRKILMTGDFISAKHAIEHAIDHNICLDYIDLHDADLSHGNFDGISINYGRFTRVNFEGANLSESSMIKTQFTSCNFTNTTMTDTACVGAQFKQTKMMNVEALYTDFRGCVFDCVHFLKNDFRQSAHFGGAFFMSKGNMCPMSKGPIFVRGLGMDVVLLDEHAIIGGTVILRKEQLFNQHGEISDIFAQTGLSPSRNALQKLWLCIRPHDQNHQKVA